MPASSDNTEQILASECFEPLLAAQYKERYACECGGAFAVGAEVLSMSGREYTPREEVEFVVEEVDDRAKSCFW